MRQTTKLLLTAAPAALALSLTMAGAARAEQVQCDSTAEAPAGSVIGADATVCGPGAVA